MGTSKAATPKRAATASQSLAYGDQALHQERKRSSPLSTMGILSSNAKTAVAKERSEGVLGGNTEQGVSDAAPLNTAFQERHCTCCGSILVMGEAQLGTISQRSKQTSQPQSQDIARPAST